MSEKLTEALLADHNREADRLIEMFLKMPDLLRDMTADEAAEYREIEKRHEELRRRVFDGQQELLALPDQKEYVLRCMALLERDTEETRNLANTLADLIRRYYARID